MTRRSSLSRQQQLERFVRASQRAWPEQQILGQLYLQDNRMLGHDASIRNMDHRVSMQNILDTSDDALALNPAPPPPASKEPPSPYLAELSFPSQRDEKSPRQLRMGCFKLRIDRLFDHDVSFFGGFPEHKNC